MWKNLGFCTFSLENILYYLDIPDELHQKRYLSRNVFDESLSSEPVPVR
jgi:hypothetical protein